MGNAHAALRKKKLITVSHQAVPSVHKQSAVPIQRLKSPHAVRSGGQLLNANAVNAAGLHQMPAALPAQKQLPETQQRQKVAPTKCLNESSASAGIVKSSAQPSGQPKSPKRRPRGLAFHRKKGEADDLQTAKEPKCSSKFRQLAIFQRKNDDEDDLRTAKERKSTSLTIGRLGIGLFKKKDESAYLKTAEDSTPRSKFRRLIAFRKKSSTSMDSTQTARELPNRSWFRRSLRRKTSPNDYTQESTKTAREHRQSISRRPNSTPHPRQDHEGEEMTQEQDSEISMSINGFNRGKTQNEIQAWVDRMLDKGVRGLRQEFTLLRVATKPTADKYQQFTVNAPFGRNRYKDVFCLDESRIVLRNHPSGNDYIHANYVSTPMTPNRFICAQAPKEETVYDFWLMVLQEQTDVIVMLGDFIEKQKAKCAQYFPQEENVNFLVSDVKVQCITKTVLTEFPCKMLRRSLLVTRNGSTLKVTHYHWSAWPDHGVPNADHSPFRLLHMIRSTKRPICVHCSAGIGRTGSIVAIEYILERLKANASCDDLIDIVKQLRKQRAGIVQTDLQYLYVHRVMLIYFTDMKLITESDRLSNFIHEYEQLIPPFQ